jgi:hypothetical protein
VYTTSNRFKNLRCSSERTSRYLLSKNVRFAEEVVPRTQEMNGYHTPLAIRG